MLEKINSNVNLLLGSTPACETIDDQDVEDELKVLELEIGAGPVQSPNGICDSDCLMVRVMDADSVSDTFSNLSLKEIAPTRRGRKSIVESTSEVPKDVNLEYA